MINRDRPLLSLSISPFSPSLSPSLSLQQSLSVITFSGLPSLITGSQITDLLLLRLPIDCGSHLFFEKLLDRKFFLPTLNFYSKSVARTSNELNRLPYLHQMFKLQTQCSNLLQTYNFRSFIKIDILSCQNIFYFLLKRRFIWLIPLLIFVMLCKFSVVVLSN